MLLFLFAFVSGLVTILAPCIWPLLPIVLAASATGKTHKKPLGITLGIIVSFSVLTLCISLLVRLLHFDPNVLRTLAVIVLLVFGVSLLMPSFGAVFELLISRLSSKLGQRRQTASDGFASGFVTGLSLGIVWTPCAGPILATMATLSALGQLSFTLVGMMVSYGIGVGIPLFAFAYGGQKLVSKTRFLSRYTGRVQQVFGVIILLTALAIFTNYDKVIQTNLLNAFPVLSSHLTGFESSGVVKEQLDALKGKQSSSEASGLLNAQVPAPDFTGGTKWLNTDKPLTLADLKGKVVLVDFWTYTCINCLRTLPFVTSWYDKYKDKGFVVIGVHTPEFQFEHETSNVQQAIKMYNIHYPVVQDNNYAIWNNYNNEYWPAEYLIDSNGVIRRTHFGEGEYDQMEQAIQLLLKDAGKNVSSKLINMPDQTPKTQLSPETYLGSERMQYYYPDGSLTNGTQTFTFAPDLPTNAYGLGGEWTISDENAVTGNNAVLIYNFYADKVFLVLRPPSGKTGTIKVFLDDKPVTKANAGQDVHDGVVTVDQDRLYNLIDLHNKPGTHLLRLEFETPGTQAFAFTFG